MISTTETRTNQQRRAEAERRRREKHPRGGPLMQVGTWAYQHGGAILDAPILLLCAAEQEIVVRLEAAVERGNARGRATVRWLSGWLARVRDEIARQKREGGRGHG